MAPGHPDLGGGEGAQAAATLFEGLRETGGVHPVLLSSIGRSWPALFKPGAHITAFDARPHQYLFLSHDIDPLWHRNREPLLVEAYAEFLLLTAPGVVHFFDFATFGIELLSLTRRILPSCRIVVSFQDALAICAADGSLVRRVDGTACNGASPVRCHHCIPERTPEDMFLRARWMMAHLAAADVFIVPSAVLRGEYGRFGLPAERLVQLGTAGPPETMASTYLALYRAPA